MKKIIIVLLMISLAMPVYAFEQFIPDEPQFDNPMYGIAEIMERAAGLLKQLDTGKPTQDEQEKILKEIDELIEKAKKKQSKSSSQQQQQQQQQEQQQKPDQQQQPSTGSSPMATEREVLRSVRHGSGPDEPDIRQMWGKLPQAERDQIMQLLQEDLPMQYKQLIIIYFKVISERK